MSGISGRSQVHLPSPGSCTSLDPVHDSREPRLHNVRLPSSPIARELPASDYSSLSQFPTLPQPPKRSYTNSLISAASLYSRDGSSTQRSLIVPRLTSSKNSLIWLAQTFKVLSLLITSLTFLLSLWARSLTSPVPLSFHSLSTLENRNNLALLFYQPRYSSMLPAIEHRAY